MIVTWSGSLRSSPSVTVSSKETSPAAEAVKLGVGLVLGVGGFLVLVRRIQLVLDRRAGEGRLYAREHFHAVRGALRDGGVFCQWLPLYQLTRDKFVALWTSKDRASVAFGES